MGKIRNRYLIVILILIGSSVINNFLNYSVFHNTEEGVKQLLHIPSILGEWKGVEVSLDDDIYTLLETKSIIHKNFTSPNSQVFLSIVHYPETKVDFHAPERCLAGKCIKISKSINEIKIAANEKAISLEVNQLIRQYGRKKELIFYFYKAGKFYGQSYIKLRLALAFNKISNKEKSGSLIRVSTPIIQEDIHAASEKLVFFISQLYPYLDMYL